MKAQTHIIDESQGMSYWESQFTFIHTLPLSAEQWFLVSRTCEKLVEELDYENRNEKQKDPF